MEMDFIPKEQIEHVSSEDKDGFDFDKIHTQMQSF